MNKYKFNNDVQKASAELLEMYEKWQSQNIAIDAAAYAMLIRGCCLIFCNSESAGEGANKILAVVSQSIEDHCALTVYGPETDTDDQEK